MADVVVPSRNGKMNNRRSWQRHLIAPESQAPDLLTGRALDRLSRAERVAYDLRRLTHIHNFPPIATPTIKVVTEALVDKVNSNYLDGSPGAKPAVALSGVPGLGKTWTSRNALRTWELVLRSDREWPIGCRTEDGGEFLPVAHTTVSSRTTIKGWLMRLLSFYEAPLSRQRRSDDELLALALTFVQACGTEVVVIDDVHNIHQGAHSNAAQVNAFLKAFANDSGVTFVFVAVDIEKTGFMAEWQPSRHSGMTQQRRRSTVLNLYPYSNQPKAEREEWLSLLRSFEEHLVLLRGRPGMLTDHADLVHARTQGILGSVTQLVRTTAQLAISTGDERVTEELLLAADLDFAAEEQTPDKLKKGRRSTRRSIINMARRDGSHLSHDRREAS